MSMVVILIPFLSSFSSSFEGSGAGAVGGVGDGVGAGGGVLLFASVPFTRAIVRAMAVFISLVSSYNEIRA